jgi:hypothetical protein
MWTRSVEAILGLIKKCVKKFVMYEHVDAVCEQASCFRIVCAHPTLFAYMCMQVADWSGYVDSAKLCNFISGHTQPLGFLLKKGASNQVELWSRSSNSIVRPADWQGADGSTTVPFVLVPAGKHVPFEQLAHAMKPCQPIKHSPEEIKAWRKGLETCRERILTLDPTGLSIQEHEDFIDTLEAAEPVPFHWKPFALELKHSDSLAMIVDDENGRNSLSTIDDDDDVEDTEVALSMLNFLHNQVMLSTMPRLM